jgi:predicted metal-dependent phosphoesterase TrpH
VIDWIFYIVAIIPILGYLELHYKFPFFSFSRYFIKEPEIFADAPHRINPGSPLPISILVKDAHRFPITLKKINIKIQSQLSEVLNEEIFINNEIYSKWWEKIIEFEIHPNLATGLINIWVAIHYDVRGHSRSIITHNVRTSSPYLLTTYLDNEDLPATDRYWYGDLHFHSNYTEDFVEFGASLKSTQTAAKAIGLDFVAITDHSYDLDDQPDSWILSDPQQTKWKQSRIEINTLNENGNDVFLIPGEEVTVSNTKGNNVHLLVLNQAEFIPGSGDGAERFLRTTTEYTVQEALNILDADALAIAAHPYNNVPFLQKLLLKRSNWTMQDASQIKLAGLQILNGTNLSDLQRGIKNWITQLLEGSKIYIYAGNDAHGNFNRYHQISIPMISTHHNFDQILGQCRTAVLKSNNKSINTIINQLRAGKCVITTGPVMVIECSADNYSYTLGDTINHSNINITIDCISSKFNGILNKLIVYFGALGQSIETIIYSKNWGKTTYISQEIIKDLHLHKVGYIRCELVTSIGRFCYSNPIWVKPPTLSES